jgi:hypothetical protein
MPILYLTMSYETCSHITGAAAVDDLVEQLTKN